MIGIMENKVAPITISINETVTNAALCLLIFLVSLKTTGSASAAKTIATNKSNINDLTRIKINTEKAMSRTYKNALFNSSCRVSPFGRFTVI
tara:strand:+ start:173 stop:448 length:276 start_codon:yes stop_codon:yes gene_type:complete